RDKHCRFPGCRQPTWRCDIDHTKDAAHGGETRICNLAHLCRRHHILKHHTPWRVRQLPDGVLEWTSPTGRIYRDIPTPPVTFTPSAVDPPGIEPPPTDPPPTDPPPTDPPPF
ncbi:MAG: HNH endonuclease, partial [Microbacterium sp.]